MSKRTPTPEEKKLWREANAHTHPLIEAEEVPQEEPATTPQKPHKKVGTIVPAHTPKSVHNVLAPLTPREAKKRRAAHPKIQASLDLHGYGRIDAHEIVQAFIVKNYQAARRHVVIITGKGRGGEGVLLRELPHWLNDKPMRPMIASFFHAPDRDGGAGVTHIILKQIKSS